MTSLSVTPLDGLFDSPFALRIEGLDPGPRVRVSVRAETLRARAQAEFVADRSGVIDVTQHAPVGGDYSGVEAGGLLWSAKFDDGADLLTMLASLTKLEPLQYTVTAETDGAEIARTAFTRRSLQEGVRRIEVREGRVRGTLFVREGARGAQPVVVLGGSDGGNNFTFMAALLAARGFAALSLAYFAYEDLPPELVEIPLEYFGEAMHWLRNRPEVDGARVGVIGMSRGGELALLLGATFHEHVAAVAALVPSGVVIGGIGKDPATMARAAWTHGGKPLQPLPPPMDPEAIDAVGRAFGARVPYSGRGPFERLLAREPELVRQTTIPVERSHAAILLLSAQDDQIWPSTAFAEIAMEQLRAAKFAYPFEHMAYPGAGHWACLPPNLPTTMNWAMHAQVPMPLAYGGNARDTAAASAGGWQRVLGFLRDQV
jgi:dienelactone hydrolase